MPCLLWCLQQVLTFPLIRSAIEYVLRRWNWPDWKRNVLSHRFEYSMCAPYHRKFIFIQKQTQGLQHAKCWKYGYGFCWCWCNFDFSHVSFNTFRPYIIYILIIFCRRNQGLLFSLSLLHPHGHHWLYRSLLSSNIGCYCVNHWSAYTQKIYQLFSMMQLSKQLQSISPSPFLA